MFYCSETIDLTIWARCSIPCYVSHEESFFILMWTSSVSPIAVQVELFGIVLALVGEVAHSLNFVV